MKYIEIFFEVFFFLKFYFSNCLFVLKVVALCITSFVNLAWLGKGGILMLATWRFNFLIVLYFFSQGLLNLFFLEDKNRKASQLSSSVLESFLWVIFIFFWFRYFPVQLRFEWVPLQGNFLRVEKMFFFEKERFKLSSRLLATKLTRNKKTAVTALVARCCAVCK